MRKLVLLAGLALGLSACGGGTVTPDPAPPYSALGTWDISGLPNGATDWRSLGYVKFTTQDAKGGLDGTYNAPDGVQLGVAAGNTTTGRVGLATVKFTVTMDGAFNGDNYAGTYSYKDTDGSAASGTVKMVRRK